MKDCIIVIPYTRVSGFCTFLEHGCWIVEHTDATIFMQNRRFL